MALTTAQLTTLKAAILAKPAWSVFPNTADGAYEIAALLNTAAVPSHTVWKTNVPLGEVGKAFVSSEVGGLTTANTNRLSVIGMYRASGVNPTLASDRAFFDDVFSGAGGTGTRAQLLAVWKRLATEGEKLFAVGTGTDASPSALVVEGNISYGDVLLARNLA